jgi:hypothetical protein
MDNLYVCVSMGIWTDRQTDTETETETDRHTHTQTDTGTDTGARTHARTHTHTHTYTKKNAAYTKYLFIFFIVSSAMLKGPRKTAKNPSQDT